MHCWVCKHVATGYLKDVDVDGSGLVHCLHCNAHTRACGSPDDHSGICTLSGEPSLYGKLPLKERLENFLLDNGGFLIALVLLLGIGIWFAITRPDWGQACIDDCVRAEIQPDRQKCEWVCRYGKIPR